ncbi:hypothetical protein, partial [Hafnia psychrotolerans]|uniref:hypothetical protein n=1 Tax=Hafnia psychrotolerans TaxID=1477018 RepID=UPI001E555DD5
INININIKHKFNIKTVGVGPHRPETRNRAGLWTPRFFMQHRQLRRSQWTCFRGHDDSRKLRRCAVLSLRVTTRAN